MSAEHTPGPWAFVIRRPFSNPQIVPNHPQRGGSIASLDKGDDWPEGEQMANARLIAAAPDLLAALVKLSRECDGSNLGTVKAPTWETLCEVETLIHTLKGIAP